MSTVGKIFERASQASLSCAFRGIFEFKAQRVELEYHKTIATHLLAHRLHALVHRTLRPHFAQLRESPQKQDRCPSRLAPLIKLVKAQKAINQWNKARAIESWRAHVKRWRVFRRVVKMQARKTREHAFKQWLRTVIQARAAPTKGATLVALICEKVWRRRMLQAFNAMRLGRRGGSAVPLMGCLAGMRRGKLQQALHMIQRAVRQRSFEVEKAGHFKQF